jgi:thioredoxin-like negative regulator of GroEL
MIDSGKETSAVKSRRRWKLLLFLFFAAGFIWGGWAWWRDRRYKSAMAEIEAEIVAGRFGTASRELVKLLVWKQDTDGGLAYLLGNCELARRRDQEAEEAWARVVPGSAYSDRAIWARMGLLQDRGRLADAEQLVRDAAENLRNEGKALLVSLVPIYNQQGRIEEAQRLIETRWEQENEKGEGASERAVQLVRLHIELTLKPIPVEAVRAFLDHAARLAPEDDRIWLGRANLAIRTGAYDEAERWLDACQRRRPDDVPVWLARLNCGIATNRIDVVQQALMRLPAAESIPSQIHRLKAWLAVNRGDLATERRELELLSAIDPADLPTLDRLAQLAKKDGQPARAAALLVQKAEIDRLRSRYETLHQRNQPIRNAVELARLAEQLGRVFEARVFLTLEISEDPNREDLRHDLERLSPRPVTVPARGRSLADLLAVERDNTGKNATTPSG